MKKNKLFKFLSSVKLAIPLMFAMTVAVAWGTIVESRYNTDMARFTVYRTFWFQILLGLLWVNILFAALSRIPYKRHHTGFVITHIGLLTLLVGAMVTNIWGIDGQLQIVEKNQNGEVLLPDLVFTITNKDSGLKETYSIERRLKEAGYDSFKNINDLTADKVSILTYIPFAKVEKTFKGENSGSLQNVAVSFRMKSPFFDVNEWLHSQQNPEFQLGPAHLSLVIHKKGEEKKNDGPRKEEKRKPSSEGKPANGDSLEVLNGSGEVVQSIPLSQLKKGGVEVQSLKVTLVKYYEQAVVAEKNKLADGGQKGMNPALELSITDGGKSYREVIYAKYPDFSLNPKGFDGFKFRFRSSATPPSGMSIGAHGASEESEAAPGAPMAHSAPSGPMPNDSTHAGMASGAGPMGGAAMAGGNVIQFHIYEGTQDKAEVVLLKNNAEVLKQWVKPGEMVQTPWMGMQLTLNDLVFNGAETQEVKPTEQTLRTEMPPSAILLKPGGAPVDEALWLIEGDARTLMMNGKVIEVYYGRKSFKLPFEIYLDQFIKKDYPGTETPMSFESHVQVNKVGPLINIHMNEPLVKDSYTLYQASYIMRPGEPVSTILSVNWDPGRWIKYIGSIILIIGIITFTLMRSRMAQNWGAKA